MKKVVVKISRFDMCDFIFNAEDATGEKAGKKTYKRNLNMIKIIQTGTFTDYNSNFSRLQSKL